MAQEAGPFQPWTAQSVIASRVVGSTPPRLPDRQLVRAALIGIADGTARVASSGMITADERHADDGVYELTSRLRERQAPRDTGRRGERRTWNGGWPVGVVTIERQSATGRAALRDRLRVLQLAALREDVSVRPDNLSFDVPPPST